MRTEALDAEGYPVPECAWHAGRSPVAACISCGRTVCRECASTAAAGYVCRLCRDRTREEGAPYEPVRPAPVRSPWLYRLVGLVPLVGVAASLASLALGASALVRRRGGRGKAGLSLAFGLLGVALNVGLLAWLALWK